MKITTCMAVVPALLIAASLIAVPPTAMGADAGEQYRALPPGGVSCASWTQGRQRAGRDEVVPLEQEGVNRAQRESWVHGYLSALNVEILPADRGSTRDLSEGIDRAGLMAFVDDYCAENPLNSLLAATVALGSALTTKWLAAHPLGAAAAQQSGDVLGTGSVPDTGDVLGTGNVPNAGSVPDTGSVPDAGSAPDTGVRIQDDPPVLEEGSESSAMALRPSVVAPLREEVATALSGTAVVQVGAYRTGALAGQAWQAFREQHSELANVLSSDIQEVDLGERGVWYRLRIGPFHNADLANVTCNMLKARGRDCFVTAP